MDRIFDVYIPLGTTCNYSANDDLHTLQFTKAHAKPFPAYCVFNNRFMVTDINSGDSSASRSQVLLSQLTTASYLSQSPNCSLKRLNYPQSSHIATDGQSISKSWCRVPSGAHDQIFITLWQLRSCFCGAPSLTKGRVSLLHMLLVLASAFILGSGSRGTLDHILVTQIWVDFKGFWRWYMTFRTMGFLDFVLRPVF
jgi:hypothetical protein